MTFFLGYMDDYDLRLGIPQTGLLKAWASNVKPKPEPGPKPENLSICKPRLSPTESPKEESMAQSPKHVLVPGEETTRLISIYEMSKKHIYQKACSIPGLYAILFFTCVHTYRKPIQVTV